MNGSSGMKFITHARTLEEMRTEFLSDIHRRLATLDRANQFASSAAEKSRIAYAVRELTDMISFWEEVKISASREKPLAAEQQSNG